jgi:ArsR family transcriptional regulator
MATAPKIRLEEEQRAAIARALADPRRFDILQQIAAVDVLPCCALKQHEALSPATISHHIKELAEAHLIDTVREGRGANLSLRRDVWNAYVGALAEL